MYTDNYALGESAENRRAKWIREISEIGGHFGQDTERVVIELKSEVAEDGSRAVREHLLTCGTIPEQYRHDSTEEKLYSKYTDIVINEALLHIGVNSRVLTERADAADVEAIGDGFSFVADAKAFRLSRTAKNQKDFKIQAMDTWKRGKPYAVVVCPIQQLPARTSQIYKQSIDRNVCILSYSHLAVVLQLSDMKGADVGSGMLLQLLQSTDQMSPSKSAADYWSIINTTMLRFDADARELWRGERAASSTALDLAKSEALNFLASERERIMKMPREEAIEALLNKHRLESREKTISRITDNGLFSMGQ